MYTYQTKTYNMITDTDYASVSRNISLCIHGEIHVMSVEGVSGRSNNVKILLIMDGDEGFKGFRRHDNIIATRVIFGRNTVRH